MTNTDNKLNRNSGRNPYTFGSPIDHPNKLIGRETIFNFIKDNLENDIKIILLHGLRRIGKSSVLQHFSHFVNHESWVCVNFDLEDKSDKSLKEILHALAKEIIDQLKLREINLPELQNIESQDFFLQEFLPQVYEQLDKKKIVFLLDEFDVAESSQDDDIIHKGSGFFSYLKSLSNQERLFIIPVVGRNVAELKSISRLYHNAPNQEIGLLDEPSAKQLITKPAKGKLTYETKAIDEIYKLCAGHPYFTQAICYQIYLQARATNNYQVTRADVDAVINNVMESAQGGLVWFWDGLSTLQQVIFSAAAEAQNRADDSMSDKGPIEILKEHGVIPTEELIEAVKQLVQKKWLDKNGQVKVELVGCWINKKYPIKKETKQLEKLNSEKIISHFERANKFHRNGENDDALREYQEILKINPNHYSSLPNFAQLNLEMGNFDKAIELYQRAYKFDPEANKQGFLNVFESYGNYLIIQDNLKIAKAQFQIVLDYEPDRASAKEKLKEIESKITAKSSQILVNNSDKSSTSKILSRLITRNFTVTTAAVIITLLGFTTLVILMVNRLSTPCPEGQEKIQFGLFCRNRLNIPKRPNINSINISNGENILFPNITSSDTNYHRYRQEGVKAYKNKQYATASQHFQDARQANINDPEVLIYENNATARQKGKPFTLAVVVPVDNAQSIAQEILRGVAQAQEQFNADGGYRGRLLEIVIANDADNPEQAKEIAKQLVEKTEILGVIGHYSSRTTKKALEEYTPATLPIISPTSTSIELKNDIFFRTVSSDAVFGKRLADYAFKLNLNEVVILYDSDSAYSRSLERIFEQEFKQLNGKVAEIIDFRTPGQNIKIKLLDSLRKNNAKGILLFPDLEDTDLSIKLVQDEELKMRNLQFLGGDTLYSSKAFTAEGLIVAVPWFRQTQESKKFANKALGFWGNEVSWRTATSFDATQAFIETLKTFSPNVSRPDIASILRQVDISAPKTAGYRLKFGLDGETISKPILVQVEGGNFTQIE